MGANQGANQKRRLTLKVSLNGTGDNPFQRYGLHCNPFPQLGRGKEFDPFERRVAQLGGAPIPHDAYQAYIREKLEGFSEEFVELCIARFVPGEYVTFRIVFPE